MRSGKPGSRTARRDASSFAPRREADMAAVRDIYAPLRPPLARHLRGDAADARRHAGAPSRVCRSRSALSGRRSGRRRSWASPTQRLIARARPIASPSRISVYVADGQTGRGIGSALLGELIARCERGPWRQMVAIVGDSANSGSIALHQALRFRTRGNIAIGRLQVRHAGSTRQSCSEAARVASSRRMSIRRRVTATIGSSPPRPAARRRQSARAAPSSSSRLSSGA